MLTVSERVMNLIMMSVNERMTCSVYEAPQWQYAIKKAEKLTPAKWRIYADRPYQRYADGSLSIRIIERIA